MDKDRFFGCGCAGLVIGAIIGSGDVGTGALVGAGAFGIISAIIGALSGGDKVKNTSRYEAKLNISIYGYRDLPRLESPAGYVYVIQDVDISMQYKIGYTNSPAARMNTFGVQLPFETEVIAILKTDNALALEKELHKKYKGDRKRGEWFDLSASQIDEIRSM